MINNSISCDIYIDVTATTWMGARLVNEFWSWEDGSILENGYINWAPKYPDVTIGHCGRIQTVADSLSWTNTDCSSLAYSVCEKGTEVMYGYCNDFSKSCLMFGYPMV